MKKRKKKNELVLIIKVLCFAFGVAAFCMMFVNALQMSEDSFVTGVDVAFGKEESILGQKLLFKFNILAVLAFCLPLLGGILVLFSDGKNKQMLSILAFLLFAGGAVLAFIMPSYVKVSYDTILGSGDYDYDFTLAIGAILSGAFSGCGGLLSLFRFLK